MRLIVTGGGTGGHLFPGIAFATGMQQRIKGTKVLFIGTRRQLDKDTLARYDFELATIECMGLKGMGITGRIKSMIQLPKAVLEARRLINAFQPDLALGVGGYVTGPVLLAARLAGYPVCIHEQNSVPGLANKILSRIADRIFISIPCSYPFAEKKTVQTGNPVRHEIIKAAAEKKVLANNELTILVLGGSQGAHGVNRIVVDAAARIKGSAGIDIKWIHQTGKKDTDQVKSRYQENGIHAQVSDFFQDMTTVYRQADFVISRAGATTLAELSVMGLPALLIPYPFAADDHQQTNALYYQHGGGAVTFRENSLTGEKLADEVMKIVNNPEKLREMAFNMKNMGRPGATDRIIDACLELTGTKMGNQAD